MLEKVTFAGDSSSQQSKRINQIEMKKQENRTIEEELITKEDLVELMIRQKIGETNLKTKKEKTNQDKRVFSTTKKRSLNIICYFIFLLLITNIFNYSYSNHR